MVPDFARLVTQEGAGALGSVTLMFVSFEELLREPAPGPIAPVLLPPSLTTTVS